MPRCDRPELPPIRTALLVCLQAILVLFLNSNFTCTAIRFARQTDPEDFLDNSNFIKLNSESCDAQLDQVYRREATIATQPKLRGYWISSGCETRPGPEYIVRKYHFINDTYFRLTQFYYLDSSCTSPFYGLEASGSVQLDKNRVNSGLLPWGQNNFELLMSPMLYQVTVLPYSREAAIYLQSRVSDTGPDCRRRFGSGPDGGAEVWQADGVPRDILVFVEYGKSVLMDFDCTRQLGFNLNEFLLLRIEETQQIVNGRKQTRRQLHLGEIATYMDERFRHRPSGFQAPLEDANNDPCPVGCYPVLHASLKAPPIFHLRTLMNDYPTGEWVSSVCESRPMNTYVTRRLVFDSDETKQWTGTYNNFHDPLCKRPFFSFTATGRVIARDVVEGMPEARRFDFRISGLSITPRDERSLSQMNTYSGYGCGRTSWSINKTQDVTNTNGCDHLRLHVPTTSEQVMMMSFSNMRTWLYVGAISNSAKPAPPGVRPTSFQPPLVRCGDSPTQKQQWLRQQQLRQRQMPGYNWDKQRSLQGAAREGISAAGRIMTDKVLLLSMLLSAALVVRSGC